MVQEQQPSKGKDAAADSGADAAAAAAADAAAAAAASKPYTARDGLLGVVALLERSVKTKDTRALMGRLLRQTALLRKHVSGAELAEYVGACLPVAAPEAAFLEAQVKPHADAAPLVTPPAAAAAAEAAAAGAAAPTPMDADDNGAAPMDADGSGAAAAADQQHKAGAAAAAPPAPLPRSALPEVAAFLHLLALQFLLDRGDVARARQVADAAVALLQQHNRRTLDAIGARLYAFYGLAHERAGGAAGLAAVRPALMAAHSTAVVRHDAVGQETLLTLLLRSFLLLGQYEQAEQFRARAQKADTWRVPAQYCRYLFYLGSIRATQLEYSEAKDVLQQAARKAPEAAAGFRVAATKWLVLVRLLLGEVPGRAEFSAPGMAAPLRAYFELTCAVRAGDLGAFRAVVERRGAEFARDRTRNLVTRLQYNVIRTGLRRVAAAYSRIPLKDVAAKLKLASADDAEYICAKAIRDGGIDAVIDHERGFLAARETADLYSTSEPQAAFHARVAFCLDLHNEAVKAMRFEPDAHRRALAAAGGRKEAMSVEAIAAAMEEEFGDDDL